MPATFYPKLFTTACLKYRAENLAFKVNCIIINIHSYNLKTKL